MSGTDLLFDPSISADGSVVVATSALQAAFWETMAGVKWTLDGAFEPLNLRDFGASSPDTSEGLSPNSDGSVIAGTQRTDAYFPFLWRSGAVHYFTLETTSESTTANDVSADGSVVVGFTTRERADDTAFLAFRWDAESGLAPLPPLPGDDESMAYAVSADGTTTVGLSMSQALGHRAVAWDARGLPKALSVPDQVVHADVRDVNADGTMVVGAVDRASPETGIDERLGTVWISGEWRNLEWLPGASDAWTYAINADGSVIVGSSGEAAIWVDLAAPRAVREILQTAGVDLTGWRLDRVWSVSADGKVLVGEGFYAGRERLWIAWLP